MIETIETIEQTACKVCGTLFTQVGGRGHRARLYCSDRCKTAAYRKSKEQAGNVTIDVTNDDSLQKRIAELEQENKDLRARLDYEERFLIDTLKRDFKVWLRTHRQSGDTTFFRRFINDRDMPSKASRAMYEAQLTLHKDRYSPEDVQLFRDAWKRMLFSQS